MNGCSFVGYTGDARAAVREEVAAAGFVAQLTKPISLPELLAAVMGGASVSARPRTTPIARYSKADTTPEASSIVNTPAAITNAKSCDTRDMLKKG